MSRDGRKEIRTLSALRRIVTRAKGRNLRVVLANGCFDLIHVGHVRYLQGAAARGDLLVVAINSDSSVRRLKGRDRPFVSQAQRAQIVAAMEGVDYVVIFKGETVKPILMALKPDFHAKGGDYTEQTVPERDTVRAYGGRVVITGGAKINSTRDLVGVIRRRFGGQRRRKGG